MANKTEEQLTEPRSPCISTVKDKSIGVLEWNAELREEDKRCVLTQTGAY